jgi:hypothetical protein
VGNSDEIVYDYVPGILAQAKPAPEKLDEKSILDLLNRCRESITAGCHCDATTMLLFDIDMAIERLKRVACR